jgi:ubiquinone/menaquinone biosynthesis C-methylase UbiE
MEAIFEKHWNTVYQTKDTTKVGWFQPKPQISLDLIRKAGVTLDSSIIDVGGGDSLLVDRLLDMGFKDITILDISSSALDKAKERLGASCSKIQWVVSDILQFKPDRKFSLWHDRAVFHFITDSDKQQHYRSIVEEALAPGGFLLLMTFSKSGPKTCSGLPVQQYDISDLEGFFSQGFELVGGLNYDHSTPSGVKQNYSVCLFRRK